MRFLLKFQLFGLYCLKTCMRPEDVFIRCTGDVISHERGRSISSRLFPSNSHSFSVVPVELEKPFIRSHRRKPTLNVFPEEPAAWRRTEKVVHAFAVLDGTQINEPFRRLKTESS